MNNISAREFLDRFANPYGESWEEFFFNSTEHSLCAKSMGELIEDIDQYGQQTTVFVGLDGMVDEGCRVAVALAIMDKPIDYVIREFDGYEIENIFEVEFTLEQGDAKVLENHSRDLLSFRSGDDWVACIWGEGEDGDYTFLIHCPSGQQTADLIAPVISERLQQVGMDVSAMRVARAEVDEDVSE